MILIVVGFYRLQRKIHISWIVAIGSLIFLIGVFLSQYVQISGVDWFISAIILVALALWKQRVYMLLVLVLGAGLFGLWRGSLEQQRVAHYQDLFHTTQTIRGFVYEDTDLGAHGEVVARLSHIEIGGRGFGGKIWTSLKSSADIKRGDTLEISGRLSEGFGTFSASMYQAEIIKIERPHPGDVARQIRDWFAGKIRQSVDEPEASLGIGYLVGQRRALPAELDMSLKIAGLTHVVVASGYNLTILVRLTRRLFARVSKYLAAFSASLMIGSFIAVTGVSPSMSRAGLVAGLALLAWYYGRKFNPLVMLSFVAGVTVLINPSYVWGDVGWQLSFMAFAGVMILAPLAQAYFFGLSKPGTIRQILGETISAQIATLPILIVTFGQLSNVAIIANLLVLPLVPLAMLLTFVAGIGSVFGLQEFIGYPAQWLLSYMTFVAEHLSKLSWAVSELTVGVWFVVIAYLGLTGVAIYMWHKTKLNLRQENIIE